MSEISFVQRYRNMSAGLRGDAESCRTAARAEVGFGLFMTALGGTALSEFNGAGGWLGGGLCLALSAIGLAEGVTQLSKARSFDQRSAGIEVAIAAHDLATNGGASQPEAPQDGGFGVAETGLFRNMFQAPPEAPPASPQE